MDWSVQDDAIDTAVTVSSNMLSMGSVAVPQIPNQMWSSDGAAIACICSRPFNGKVVFLATQPC